jgi:hypothetical protein
MIPAQFLPPDKAQHLIAGTGAYLCGVAFALLTHQSKPAAMGLAVAVMAGAAKEGLDWLTNSRAMAAGQLVPHQVSWLDWLATASGGALMYAAAMLGGV